MSIWKPRGSPYFQYEFQWKGARFRGRTGTTSREEAKAIEAVTRSAVIKKEFFDAKDDMTIDAAFGRYFTEVAEHQRSSETTLYQLANIRRLLGCDTLLSEVTDDVVSSFVARRRGERVRRWKRRGAPFVSPATVNREVELLRRVMYRARDLWEINVGFVHWKKQKLEEDDFRSPELSDEEEARLLSAAADYLKAPIRFSLLTGVRLANTMTLDWSQVDMQARVMWFIVKSKKRNKKLLLPITGELLALLANQGPQAAGRVFTRRGGHIKSWRTAWEGAKRRAGIKDFRWHDLRHIAGSRMVERGVDISVVQDVLGHSDIATTRRYVHHKQDAKLRAMEALSGTPPQTIPKAAYADERK